jgi:hypothetical protein
MALGQSRRWYDFTVTIAGRSAGRVATGKGGLSYPIARG